MQGNSTKQITQEMINNENMRVECFLYGSAGSIITPGTYHPMLYQDGDGTWEPYTGGRPSPSPEYPQEIVSTDVTAVTVTGAQVIPYPYLDTTKHLMGLHLLIWVMVELKLREPLQTNIRLLHLIIICFYHLAFTQRMYLKNLD